MKITLVAAVSRNNVIGNGNKLPWRIKDEMAHFHEVTKDKLLVVGRKTFDGLPKSMKERQNVLILSREDPRGFSSLLAAVKSAKDGGFSELVVIGGASIYKQAMAMADELIISYIHKNVEGDVYMPEIPYSLWKVNNVKKNPEFTTIWWVRKDV